jgi:hypothetical protein
MYQIYEMIGVTKKPIATVNSIYEAVEYLETLPHCKVVFGEYDSENDAYDAFMTNGSLYGVEKID